MVVLPHPSPPLWIPAFAGMTKWGAGMTMTWLGAGLLSVVGGWMGGCLTPAAPLDSGLRRNDEVLAGMTGWGAGMTIRGGRRSRPPPPLWIGRRNWDVPGGWMPHPSPPLWIPAFAGMTNDDGAPE